MNAHTYVRISSIRAYSFISCPKTMTPASYATFKMEAALRWLAKLCIFYITSSP